MLTRTEFLKNSWKILFGAAAKAADQALPGLPNNSNAALLRPPGAVAEFEKLCTACPDCVQACPENAIQLDSDTAVDKIFPYINPRIQACTMCLEQSCIKACTTGALSNSQPDRFPPMGYALINENSCLAFNGISCMSCYDACPLKHRAIKLKNMKPQIDTGVCTGCGLCVQYCVESTGSAISIISTN